MRAVLFSLCLCGPIQPRCGTVIPPLRTAKFCFFWNPRPIPSGHLAPFLQSWFRRCYWPSLRAEQRSLMILSEPLETMVQSGLCRREGTVRNRSRSGKASYRRRGGGRGVSGGRTGLPPAGHRLRSWVLVRKLTGRVHLDPKRQK